MAILLADAAAQDWSTWLIPLAGIVGAVIAWVVQQCRLGHEITNLKAQTANSAAEFLTKVQNSRQRYVESCRIMGDLISGFSALIDNNASLTELDAKREQLCCQFLNVVIPVYLDDVEWQILERREEGLPDEMSAVIKDAVAELLRFKKWLDIVNTPVLLTYLKRSPAKLTDRTFRPLDKVLNRLPDSIKNVMRRQIQPVIDSLVQ